MRKILFLIFIILINCISLYGQTNDIVINARNTNVQITNQSGPSGTVAWSTLSSQAYVLAPLNPDQGFCLSVVNNNPTNSHSFTATAFQTGDSNAFDYSHNTGRYANINIVGTPSPIAALTTSTFFVKSNGAAKVAFVFSGAVTQAGTPDTVDIYAVQTTANGCGTVNPNTGQGYNLSTPNSGGGSAPVLQAVSDGLGQAFFTQSVITNPGAASVLFNINPNGSIKNIYLDRILISSTAVNVVTLNLTSSLGVTCTALSAGNLKSNVSGLNSIATINNACATPPTQLAPALITSLNIPAAGTVVLDLRGFILVGANGFEVQQNGVLTGTVNISLIWYEK